MAIRGQSLDKFFSLATFCILMLCCYGKSTDCLNKSGDQVECSFLTLTCPPGHVIYDPVVIGDEDATCARYDVRKCKGMSPDLNVNILNCYWKNECNIFLPKRTMAFKFDNETMDCFNQPVKSVWVRGWKCVNETEIHDICNRAYLIARMGTKGIIRSHTDMPWNYKRSLFESSQNGQCQTTLDADLNDHAYINIALSVYSIDVDKTSELVAVTYKSNGTKIFKNISAENLDEYFKGDQKTEINIKFSTNNDYDETKAGSGFVLCYKYFKRGEKIHRDFCDEIFKNNTTTPNCAVCRYEETGTWTECNDEMETQLIAKVTSKSHRSCEKTKAIHTKFCYCEYHENFTKCNLETKTYTQTKTLTDDSDAELCPKKIVTDYQCECKYKKRCRRGIPVTKLTSGDPKICPKKKEVSGKCRRGRKRKGCKNKKGKKCRSKKQTGEKGPGSRRRNPRRSKKQNKKKSQRRPRGKDQGNKKSG